MSDELYNKVLLNRIETGIALDKELLPDMMDHWNDMVYKGTITQKELDKLPNGTLWFQGEIGDIYLDTETHEYWVLAPEKKYTKKEKRKLRKEFMKSL